jgi:hypothetical protein
VSLSYPVGSLGDLQFERGSRPSVSTAVSVYPARSTAILGVRADSQAATANGCSKRPTHLHKLRFLSFLLMVSSFLEASSSRNPTWCAPDVSPKGAEFLTFHFQSSTGTSHC